MGLQDVARLQNGKMNDHFFNCHDCRVYVEAAYRWGYSNLVQVGPVVEYKPVDVDAVLSAGEFWNPPETSEHAWIRDALPRIRDFLITHRNHKITYSDRQEIDNVNCGFDWIEESNAPELTPRYLAEVMKFRSWDEVREENYPFGGGSTKTTRVCMNQ
jgi:hypothetical protein